MPPPLKTLPLSPLCEGAAGGPGGYRNSVSCSTAVRSIYRTSCAPSTGQHSKTAKAAARSFMIARCLSVSLLARIGSDAVVVGQRQLHLYRPDPVRRRIPHRDPQPLRGGRNLQRLLAT